jgi:hypothetical protein
MHGWFICRYREVCGMRKCVTLLIIVFLLSMSQVGCSKSFWGGAAVGAAGAGAAYEYSNKKQLDELEEDFKAGRITREEYLRRKEDIKKGSIIY